MVTWIRDRLRPTAGRWILLFGAMSIMWPVAASAQFVRLPVGPVSNYEEPGPIPAPPAENGGAPLPEDDLPPGEGLAEPEGEEEEVDECEELRAATTEQLVVEYEKLMAACCADDGCGCYGECEECDWCCLGEAWSLSEALCGCEEPPFTFGGWSQWGYYTGNTGLFNQHDDQIQNNQSWFYIEKVADGSIGFDYGFRVDMMYGTDAQDTQAFGEPAPMDHWDNPWDHGIYGWAMPQLYAEFAYDDFSVKIGHFFTLVGYEVVTAPDNFFYSHAFTMYNSEPFTHTGAIGTYNVSDDITVYGGWTAGWDTGFDRFSDGDQSKGTNFMGGASWSLLDDMTVTYILTLGDMGTRGEGYTHSIVADIALTEKLNWVVQSDLVELNTGGVNHQYGLNQYLIYTVNDCLGYGLRGEWWKTNGESIYEITGGVNYRPSANLILRPEVRHQWGSERIGFTTDETIFGVDAILTF